MKSYNNKILIVATEFPPGPGGIGSHAYSMAKAFCAKGYCVSVIASADYQSQEAIAQFDTKQPFEVLRFSRRKRMDYFRRFVVVGKYLINNQISELVVSGKFALWIGLWIRMSNRKIHVMGVLHGSEVNLGNWLLRIVTHVAIYSLHELVSVSNFTKSLIPFWITNRRRVTVIPNGIDLKVLDKMDITSRKSLKGYPVLLTVGNVTPRKGQHRVIRAMSEILKHYPQAHYHIVGLPTYQASFEQIARDCGVDAHVTFHGRASNFEDVLDFYCTSDIFMILSENQPNGDVEGFGIVILEAGYCNLPTIGSLGCGIEDAIKEGYNGCLVDGDDPTQIREKIDIVLNNKESFSCAAKLWAVDHDWHTIINQFVNLLK